MKLTEHQREVLERRVSRALCWAAAKTFEKDLFNAQASAVVRELEFAGDTASAQRRAIVSIVERIEEPA